MTLRHQSTETSGVESEAPGWWDFFHIFARIGLFSFGGPAAQISLMHHYLVDKRKWLTEKQYLNALSFCMLLPGPEAMQLATYSGWKLYGVRGGLLAGLLFILPGAVVIITLAAFYAFYGSVPIIDTLFLGIQSAVVMIVIAALLKVSNKALKRPQQWMLALFAFVGIFFLQMPFPVIIAIAALYGAVFMADKREQEDYISKHEIPHSFSKTLKTILLWLVIWLAPLFLLDIFFQSTLLNQIAVFFSKLAVVTFGGAYAVLTYMAQQVVQDFSWLTADEMIDALGLAEATPGPLILVTEFVGFLAAFREGGVWFGIAGALVTLWVTFVPCFLWIFAGAPYIERLSAQARLASALSAISAAVVGVILNLTIWFALHVFFENVSEVRYGLVYFWQPDLLSFDCKAGLLALMSGYFLLLRGWAIGFILAMAACASLGLVVFEFVEF